nr:iron chelate uptake ABC transporter family permease subunit [Aristophania vespae]
MTLTGIALSTVSVALLSLILNLVPSPYARYEMMHWLMGSLNQVDLNDVLIASPGLIIGCIFLMKTRHSLDGLALGDDVAFTMGINPYHVHLLIIAGTALSLGSAVAIAGNIAFIGLIVPHIIRYVVGFRPSDSLLPSALLGGCYWLVPI